MMKIKHLGIYLFPIILPLPLPMKYSAMALIILLINLVFLIKKSDLYNVKPIISNPLLLLFFLFFLTDLIGALVNLNMEQVLFREVKLAFLILPISLLFHQNLIIKIYDNLIKAFLYGVIGYIIIAWSYVYYYYTILNPTYIFDFTDHFVVYVLAKEFPYSIHHTYIGIYILLITIIVFSNTILYKKINFLKGLFLTFFLLINSFYIGGKSTTSLLVIFITIILVKSYFKGRNIIGYKYYIIGFIITVILGVYSIYEWLSISVKQSFGFRVEIYNRCFYIIKDIFPFGIGKSRLEKVLLDQTDLLRGYIITHNIYFNELIINGLIGLLVLIIMLSYLCYIGYRTQIYFYLFTLSIIIIGLFEDILTRQRGVLFFVFFASIFCIKYFSTRANKKSKIINEKNHLIN